MLGAMDFGIADHRQPSGAQTVDSDMVEITRDALARCRVALEAP